MHIRIYGWSTLNWSILPRIETSRNILLGSAPASTKIEKGLVWVFGVIKSSS